MFWVRTMEGRLVRFEEIRSLGVCWTPAFAYKKDEARDGAGDVSIFAETTRGNDIYLAHKVAKSFEEAYQSMDLVAKHLALVGSVEPIFDAGEFLKKEDLPEVDPPGM